MINTITPWLYQGDNASVTTNEYKQYPIGAILCVHEGYYDYFDRTGIPYLHLPMNDDGDRLTEDYLCKARDFLKAHREKGILVHCVAGINRSSAMASYLLSLDECISFERAMEKVSKSNYLFGVLRSLVKKYNGLIEERKGV